MEEYRQEKNCVIMTRRQVRAVDSWAINELGISGVVLIENAGRSCAELIRTRLAEIAEPKVCIFCGTSIAKRIIIARDSVSSMLTHKVEVFDKLLFI